MQKHVNLVDLVKSFPTNIYLQNLASIQKRTRPVKFAHLAEESDHGSVSNLSTKASTGRGEASAATEATAPLESTSRREIALFSQDYQVCSIRDNQKTLHAIRVAVSLRARTASE